MKLPQDKIPTEGYSKAGLPDDFLILLAGSQRNLEIVSLWNIWMAQASTQQMKISAYQQLILLLNDERKRRETEPLVQTAEDSEQVKVTTEV